VRCRRSWLGKAQAISSFEFKRSHTLSILKLMGIGAGIENAGGDLIEHIVDQRVDLACVLLVLAPPARN